ncbi:MAG: hypothetical protein IAE80_02180 [Anaerolinea sp.]|nr:hypothetical protein [Anaerolinea sp.]
MKQEAKLKKHEDLLKAVLKFDEDDLAANHTGAYSPYQIAWLKRHRTNHMTTAAIMSAIVTGIVLIPIAISVSAYPLLIFAALFTVLAFFAGGMRAYQVTRALRKGISMVEGRIDLDASVAQTSQFYVRVEGVRFTVKKEVFFAFKNGDPYRVYYAPYLKQMLAVEWLRDDNPFVEDEEAAAPKRKRRLEIPVPADENRLITDDGELREDAR